MKWNNKMMKGDIFMAGLMTGMFVIAILIMLMSPSLRKVQFDYGVRSASNGTYRYIGLDMPDGSLDWSVWEIPEGQQVRLPTTILDDPEDIIEWHQSEIDRLQKD